jgi:ATP synthase protein I
MAPAEGATKRKATMSLIGPEGKKQLQLAARFATAGIELALAIVIGYFAGVWLDGRFETKPYLTYIGLLLGIIAGFRNLFMLARSAQTAARESSNEPSPPPPDDSPPS